MCVRVCVRVCVRATYVWTCLLGCILLCVYLSLPFGYRRRNVIFPITISNVLVFQGRRVAKSRHWGKKSWHLTGWFWDPNSTFRNRMPTFMHLHNETNRVYWWESKERKSLQSGYGKGSCMKQNVVKWCEMWNLKRRLGLIIKIFAIQTLSTAWFSCPATTDMCRTLPSNFQALFPQ